MKLEELLNKRLIFITGKGGVGKTTVTILLGLLASQKKKNTILVEMNSSGRIPPVFGTETPTHKEVPVAPYLSTVNITPPACFEEYVLQHIHFKTIYNVVFNNSFVMNFINATPGLAEILMLGKIYDLEKQQKKRSGGAFYDLIIVDAPATGHGLSALQVPQILLNAVSIRPLHCTAKKILGLFTDQERTALSLVTLAEEMPVNETEELYHDLKEKTGLGLGPVFVNRIMTGPPKITQKTLEQVPSELLIYRQLYELAAERADLNIHYTGVLHERLKDEDFIMLPNQPHDLDHHNELKVLVKNLQGFIA